MPLKLQKFLLDTFQTKKKRGNLVEWTPDVDISWIQVLLAVLKLLIAEASV